MNEFSLTKGKENCFYSPSKVEPETAPSKGFCASQNNWFYGYKLHGVCSVYIKLKNPKRSNQKNYKSQPYIFRKSRKKIKTHFSQLCDQFLIRRNYAKSFEGFKTRISAKLTALTLAQYINKFIFNRPINNIKIQII